MLWKRQLLSSGILARDAAVAPDETGAATDPVGPAAAPAVLGLGVSHAPHTVTLPGFFSVHREQLHSAGATAAHRRAMAKEPWHRADHASLFTRTMSSKVTV